MSEKDKKYLLNLIDFVSESLDKEDLKNELKEEGFSYEELVQEGLNLVHGLDREQRIKLWTEKRNKFLAIIKDVVSKKYEGTKEELLSSLIKILPEKEQSPAIQTYFRKLESAEEDELKNIIEDAEILKLLEKELDK